MNQISGKLVSCLSKVYPDSEPESAENLSLSGLRGETLSFQAAVFNGDRRLIRAFISASCGELPVKVRSVCLVPCAYPCHSVRDDDYERTAPGLYPDLLREVPADGMAVPASQWRSFWVDVKIPEDMPAGDFSVEVTVSVSQEEGPGTELRWNVPVHVIGASLPALSIPHTEWFHCDCLADYYGVPVFSEEHWRIIENFVRTAAEHSMNMLLTPVFTPPLDTAKGGERTTVQLVDVKVDADGTCTFGFEKLRRWISMAKRCGIRYLEISHLFSQWGAFAAPKIMAEKDGKYVRIFGWETDSAGKEYRSFLHRFLPELKDVLRQEGMLDHTYFHISDEPTMENMESYKAALEGVSEDLKDVKRFDALSDYTFFEQGLVPVPVCSSDHLKPFLENRPKELWTYYCTAQYKDVSNRFIAMPGYRTRVLGAQLYKENIQGFLQWGYNFYNCALSLHGINPYEVTDAEGAFPSGDPFIVYPGKGGVPEESLRLMLIDGAFADFRAMSLLEQLTSREHVLAVLSDFPLAMDRYPKSAEGVSEIRRRINAAIEEAL